MRLFTIIALIACLQIAGAATIEKHYHYHYGPSTSKAEHKANRRQIHAGESDLKNADKEELKAALTAGLAPLAAERDEFDKQIKELQAKRAKVNDKWNLVYDTTFGFEWAPTTDSLMKMMLNKHSLDHYHMDRVAALKTFAAAEGQDREAEWLAIWGA